MDSGVGSHYKRSVRIVSVNYHFVLLHTHITGTLIPMLNNIHMPISTKTRSGIMGFFSSLFRKKKAGVFYGHPYSQAKPSGRPGSRHDPTRAEIQLCRGHQLLVDENLCPVTRSISLNFETGEYSRDIERLIVESKMLICYAESGGWDPHYFRRFVNHYLVREKVQFLVDDDLGFLEPESPELYHSICTAWHAGETFKIFCRWADF
jgi:hypothetical protein